MSRGPAERAGIRVEQHDRLAVLTIANPAKRNALDPELLFELARTLDALGQGDARAAVLRGEGDKLFSSGYDIGAIRGGAAEEASRHPLSTAIEAIERFPYPVLALVFGGAYGAGVEVVCACDLRFASDDARFAIPAGKLSVVYDPDGVARLAERASPTLVAELMLTARPMPASRALALGLLNGVHPAAELEREVLGLAREVASLAPRTLRATKQMLHALRSHGGFTEVEVAHFTRLRNEALASPDFAEGRRAFAEKRPPRFGAGRD
ncbi:MAG: enoyl-CoA hydratase-related protein [Thermodesulfobacteriota bacterium]